VGRNLHREEVVVGLAEPDKPDIVCLWRNERAVRTELPIIGPQVQFRTGVDERERLAKARAEDDRVGENLRPVGQTDAVGLQPFDAGFPGGYRAVGDAVGELAG
jgi:hypothetical protein